jgi:predicted transcriptional regulator
MKMKNRIQKHYPVLTNDERIQLIVSAAKRDDIDEVKNLVCSYSVNEAEKLNNDEEFGKQLETLTMEELLDLETELFDKISKNIPHDPMALLRRITDRRKGA